MQARFQKLSEGLMRGTAMALFFGLYFVILAPCTFAIKILNPLRMRPKGPPLWRAFSRKINLPSQGSEEQAP